MSQTGRLRSQKVWGHLSRLPEGFRSHLFIRTGRTYTCSPPVEASSRATSHRFVFHGMRGHHGKGRPDQGRDITVSKALSYILRHAAEREGLKMNAQGYANVADVLAWRKLRSLKVTFPEILRAVDTSDKKRFALLHIPSAEAERTKQEATTIPTTASGKERSEGLPGDEPTTVIGGAAPTTSAGQESATQTALSVDDDDPCHFLIRATQGHSIKSVDAASFLEKLSLSDDESTLPTTVVHGTYHATWPLIVKSGGLRCMTRNHVHFATGPSLESVLSRIKETTTSHAADGRAEAEDSRVISGMRRDAQVLIYIDLKKALAAGCPFWRSENGVILSEGLSTAAAGEEQNSNASQQQQKIVPLDFFDVVVERKRGLGVLWENGKEVQELPAELTTQRNPKGKTPPSSSKSNRTERKGPRD